MKNLSKFFLTLTFLLTSFTYVLTQVPDDINGRLWRLAKVWGMAKYYHPNNCTVDWNKILLQTIDSVLVSSTNLDFNEDLVEMLDASGDIPTASMPLVNHSMLNLNAKFSWKDDPLFSQDVRNFLDSIIVNFRPVQNCLVIDNDQSDPDYNGWLSFKNDNLRNVPSFSYSIESHRLLALFYYWNIINYYNPNKELMDQNWDTTLYQFIPLVRAAKNDTAFHLLFLNLVTYINDSHGFTSSTLIRQHFGTYYPNVIAKRIEGQTIVTNVGSGIPDLLVGDIIKKINGIGLENIVDSLRGFFPASNEHSLIRDIYQQMLSGPENTIVNIEFENAEGAIHTISLPRNLSETDFYNWYYSDPNPMWKITSCGYGYIDMGQLTTALVSIVYNNLKNAPAIIFDCRNYPNGTIWSLIPKLFSMPKTWALLPVPDLTFPGWYNWIDNKFDAGSFNNHQPYTGKVIILVNEETQSQAEYSVMALQVFPNSFTIGSQSAGADGDVSNITLPGGLYSYWSSLGIFYPDTTHAQRVGVRIDSIVEPTIEDIRSGKDVVLLAALDCLTDIQEQPGDAENLFVYPNPVSDEIFISLDHYYDTPISVIVTNDIGQNVFSQSISLSTSNPFPIKVSEWATGIYFIQVISEGKLVANGRFVKQ